VASRFWSHSGEKLLGEKRQQNAGGTNCAIDVEISIRDIIADMGTKEEVKPNLRR
jgi:hypothetical protein